jgi:hypothetical protein
MNQGASLPEARQYKLNSSRNFRGSAGAFGYSSRILMVVTEGKLFLIIIYRE